MMTIDAFWHEKHEYMSLPEHPFSAENMAQQYFLHDRQ